MIAALSGTLFLSLLSSAALAIFIKSDSSGGSSGKIALRSYFETGTGTDLDPYVITRPRHLYNLSRLQRLNIFGPSTHFRLGLTGLSGQPQSKGPLVYASDTSWETTKTLDMDPNLFASPYEIYSIGTEGVPFYSTFDGQGLEIANLHVKADPHDAGLFGYTAAGSLVKNLFLESIVIETLGYDSSVAWQSRLFSDASCESGGLLYDGAFLYNAHPSDPEFDETKEFNLATTTSSDYAIVSFAAESIGNFVFDEETDIPEIGFTKPSDNLFSYSVRSSNPLLSLDGGKARPNVNALFQFFGEKKEEEGASYPIKTSSSLSLVATYADPSSGMTYSRVLLSLDFYFTLDNASDLSISMETRVGEQHKNYVGLFIGHCDGSIENCFAHNGKFNMNTLEGPSSAKLSNISHLGLVGKIGSGVQGRSAIDAKGGTTAGTDNGMLDFTTIYNDIIPSDTSFTPYSSYYHYSPNGESKYVDFLRRDVQNQYSTKLVDSAALKGKQVISNTDLGVFTYATDYQGENTGSTVETNWDNSLITKANPSVDGKYYVYYTTAEYNKADYYGGTSAMDQYTTALTSHYSGAFHTAYSFPAKTEYSLSSMRDREARHNYIIRFALEPTHRSNYGGLYLSDLDYDSTGGHFISDYLEYKLIDKYGSSIPHNTPDCGIMLQDTRTHEIGSLTASISTPNTRTTTNDVIEMFCINNDDTTEHYATDGTAPVANAVNFKIESADYANVTIVASSSERSKPSAVGIYRITESDFTRVNNQIALSQDFLDPDYAFFIPSDDYLAYFDYTTSVENGKSVGSIGVYNSLGKFSEADEDTFATAATGSDYGYAANKPRLFAHTFKLPRGRYCVATPLNTNQNKATQYANAAIYYLAAQGQINGTSQFRSSVFVGDNHISEVDFLKKRGADITGEGDETLEKQRAYVSLVETDPSIFGAASAYLRFAYENNQFKLLTDDLTEMLYVALSNYGAKEEIDGVDNVEANLFGQVIGSGNSLVYSRSP
ncbi:MAG: hypothetical protein K6E59_06575 [Bacilli bacterium]|nr:hypothetical protein [Bacilli bacterium]